MQKLRLALWVLIGIGTLAGLYGATQRFSAESKNRVVELTLDIVELQKLAAAEGKPLYEVLKRFKEAGVTSVAVTEDTLGTLEENRQIEVIPNAQLNTSYIVAHQGNFDRIVEAIQHRTHLGNQLSLPPGLDNRRLMDVGLTIPQPFHTIKSIGVGLDPNVISQLHDEAHKLHLSVVGRVSNSVNITEEGIHWTLQRLKEQGVHTVIFSGDDVLGYDSQLKVTASAFRDLGLNYGAVEFSKAASTS